MGRNSQKFAHFYALVRRRLCLPAVAFQWPCFLFSYFPLRCFRWSERPRETRSQELGGGGVCLPPGKQTFFPRGMGIIGEVAAGYRLAPVLTHAIRVRRLYRRALKLTESWACDRVRGARRE